MLAFAAAALLMVAGAATFAWLVTPAPEPERAPVPVEVAQPGPGAALFARHCAGCHTRESLTTALGSARDPAATQQAWAALLTHHGATSDTEDRAVLEFLMTPPPVESLDNRRRQ